MDKSLVYRVDDIAMNPYVIQEGLDIAKLNDHRYQSLTQIFRAMDLYKSLENDKQNPTLKQTFKQIIRNKFVDNEKIYQNLNIQKINFNEIYILNKSGSFGRDLIRSSKIKNGNIIEQWEGNNKDHKEKQIQSIEDKIQRYGEKGNNQLAWIRNNQYPFRVLLKDNKKNIKALYFKTFEQATRVKIHYLNEFKIKFRFNIPQLIKRLEKQKQNHYLELFRRKIIATYRTMRKSVSMHSKKIISEVKASDNTPKNIKQDNYRESTLKDPVQSFIRQSNTRSMQPQQGGYDRDFVNNLLERQQRQKTSISNINSKFNFSTLYQLELKYKQQLFHTWANKARYRKQQNFSKYSSKSKAQLRQQTDKLSLSNNKPITLKFLSVEFLKLNNIYIKPIVSIQITKNDSILYQSIFNTFLKKRSPNLLYKLLVSEGIDVFNTQNIIDGSTLKDYVLKISVIDYLSNEEILKDIIPLKNKIFSTHTYLFNAQKSVKIQMKYNQKNRDSLDSQYRLITPIIDNQKEDDIAGLILELDPINQQIVSKIKTYWQEQSTKKGYYSIDAKMKIVEILSLGADTALSWWLGISQQIYQILSLLKTASDIIGFKLIQSIIPIINYMKQLYSQLQDLVEAIISVIVNYMSYYYFPQNFNKISKLHSLIGVDSHLDFTSKIQLQMDTFDKLIELQSPMLSDKLARRNITLKHQIFQYIYEIYSKNFPLKILVEIWNFLFKNVANGLIQVYLFLLGVWLVRYYELELRGCHRFKDIIPVLQSKKIGNSQMIIRQILQLKEKYFSENNDSGIGSNIVSGIKNMFTSKPLEKVLFDFYRKQTEKIDDRKQKRQLEKRTLLTKLSTNNLKNMVLPIYPCKKYILHIYILKNPQVSGSLYIKCDGIQYQCIGYEKKHYFIVSQVSSQIYLEFIDNKSNQYTCQIDAILGINSFKKFLYASISQDKNINKKKIKCIQIQYICGLLTQNQIQVLKKNKNFEHFIGSYMPLQNLNDQFLRPINDVSFLKDFNSRADREDIGRKIKILFSQGNKSFNEVQFYLRWIQSSTLTLQEKLEMVRQFAENISKQYFLCHNKILEKIFTKNFLEFLEFPLLYHQYQSYYNDSIGWEFDCPKIVKCRFFGNGKQIKLEKQALFYAADRSSKFLHGDIFIEDILNLCKNKIQDQIGANMNQGKLSLLFSTNGQLFLKNYSIGRKKHNKQLYIEEITKQSKSITQQINSQQPQILMTQVLPTFAKISTILDYVNTRKPSQIKLPKEKKKLAQNINILKNCQAKTKKMIILRYANYPNHCRIPFLAYFYNLNYKIKSPEFPSIFFNNTRSDIKAVCISTLPMKFSENKRGETLIFERKLGLYGNLRKLISSSESIFFWTYQKQQFGNEDYQKIEVFISYGYGLFRWQNCYVKGYRLITKQRISKAKQMEQPTYKKQYLVVHKNQQFFVRQYEMKINQQQEKKLTKIQQNQIYDKGQSKLDKSTNKNLEFVSKFMK